MRASPPVSLAGIFSAVVTVLLLLSTPCAALEPAVQLGGHLRIGGASISDDDTPDESQPDLGIAGVGQIFAVFKFMPELGVGLVLDGTMSSHELDSGDGEATTAAGTLGLMVRSDLFEVVALALWLGYTWGELEVEVPTVIGTLDLSVEGAGFGFGLDALYRISLGALPLWLEVGPYLTFGSYEADDEDENGDDNTILLTFGAAVQVTFEIPL